MPRPSPKTAATQPPTKPAPPKGFQLLERRAYRQGNAVHYSAFWQATGPELVPARIMVSVRRDFYPDQSYAHIHGFDFEHMAWSNPLATVPGSRMKALAVPATADPGDTIPAAFLEDEAELLRLAALVLGT